MISLNLNGQLIILILVAALLSRWSGLMFDSNGRLRWAVHLIFWLTASLVLSLTVLARPIDDDEVFYFIQALAGQRGELSGSLPMRIWMYEPFLSLHLSPAATLFSGRITMLAGIFLVVGIVVCLCRRADPMGFTASIIGAISAITFGNLPIVSLIPEGAALVFLVVGIWAVVSERSSEFRKPSLFLGGMLLALSFTTSLRMVFYSIGALVAVRMSPGKLKRSVAIIWILMGMGAGILPSIIYIIATHSFQSIIYWNYTIPQKIGIVESETPLALPLITALIAIIGCIILWRGHNSIEGGRALVVLWITALISSILNPTKLDYTLGPLMAISLIVGSATLTFLLNPANSLGNRRVYIFAFSLLFFTQITPNLPVMRNPASVRDIIAEGISELQLINWLDKTAGDNPVACVSPYHPVRAPNAWHMWNSLYYCYVRDPQLSSELNPDLLKGLLSQRPAIIQWDPWPSEADVSNILEFMADRKFVSTPGMIALAGELKRDYVLVQWPHPLPQAFGGGRFLIRRDISFENDIRRLDDSLMLP